MPLTPRYDDRSFLRVDVPPADPAAPLMRQRRRLAATLGRLDERQWAAPSPVTRGRCATWPRTSWVTNQFWSFSVAAALGGEPTRLLATFDPVVTPAQLVEARRDQPAADVLVQLVETNEALADAVTGIGREAWSTLGEAPPGHVPLHAVVLHALWDAWIHERDVVLPLGLPAVEEPDEVAAGLAYAAALSPLLAVARGDTRRGAIVVEATDPDVRVVVEVDDSVTVRTGEAPTDALRLTGSAVDLVEALSVRAPLPCAVADDRRWLLDGLAEVFGNRPP